MIQTTVADQIIQVINDLCQKFGIVIDWSAENLIPVAEHLGGRIMNWCIAENIFGIVFCAILVAVGIVVAVKTYGKCKGYGGYETIVILSTAITLIGGAGFCVSTFDIVKCLTFPELRIFEYIQGFMQ